MENKLSISEKGKLLNQLDERVVLFLDKLMSPPVDKESINRKITHTTEVMQASLDINDRLEKPLDNGLILPIAFLHDTGRFDQAKRGSGVQLTDPLGEREKEILLTIKPIIESTGLKKVIGKKLPLVTNAIAAHGIDYKGSQPYALLLRDADRLALARAVEVQLGVYKRNPKLDLEGISEYLVDKFVKGRVLPSNKVRTTADAMLRFLSWYPHLHFEETKQIFIKENLPRKIFKKIQMGELHVGGKSLKQISSIIDSWEIKKLDSTGD